MKHSVLVVFGVVTLLTWGVGQAVENNVVKPVDSTTVIKKDAGPAKSAMAVTVTSPVLSKKVFSKRSLAENSATPKVRGHFGTKEFRIGAEDMIRVSVWRNPELNVTVPVRPDGKISVPLIGDVQAGGLTPEQVAGIIKKKLSMFIREPRVAVILTSMRSHEFISRVRVTGAVRTPKSIPYRQGMTVLDVVLEAGGLNDFASGNRTRLYRKANGKTVVMKVKLGRILKKGKLETNYSVKPGDIISVPERIF